MSRRMSSHIQITIHILAGAILLCHVHALPCLVVLHTFKLPACIRAIEKHKCHANGKKNIAVRSVTCDTIKKEKAQSETCFYFLCHTMYIVISHSCNSDWATSRVVSRSGSVCQVTWWEYWWSCGICGLVIDIHCVVLYIIYILKGMCSLFKLNLTESRTTLP